MYLKYGDELWRAVVPANADSKMSDPVSPPPSSTSSLQLLLALLADNNASHCLIVHVHVLARV